MPLSLGHKFDFDDIESLEKENQMENNVFSYLLYV